MWQIVVPQQDHQAMRQSNRRRGLAHAALVVRQTNAMHYCLLPLTRKKSGQNIRPNVSIKAVVELLNPVRKS
jgi:hypothetical protein